MDHVEDDHEKTGPESALWKFEVSFQTKSFKNTKQYKNTQSLDLQNSK